jgi:hypothetical protein
MPTTVSDIMLPTSSAQPREVVYLTLFRLNSVSAPPKYYITAKYVAPAEVGYLEVPPGQTLTLFADGQDIKLDSTGSINSRKAFKQKDVDFVTESAHYLISKKDMERLGFARKITVQLKGSKLLVAREFSAENYESMRAFVTRAVL